MRLSTFKFGLHCRRKIHGLGIPHKNSAAPFSSASLKIPVQPKNIRGIFPIVVTPFRNDAVESIDLDSFRRSIAFMMHSGACQGVTITGVLGESNRITDRERQSLLEVAKETIQSEESNQQDKFHLCVGTSYSGTAATVALSQMAQEFGASSVMITPTKDNASSAPPSDDDILTLYRRVFDACGPTLDVVLQDHPSSSGVHLSLDLIARIVKEVPTVRCIKLESLPTINRLAGLTKIPTNDHSYSSLQDCNILTGLGALYAGFDLEQGQSDGFMTGFAFPEILYAMNDYAQNGHYEKSHVLYKRFLPLIVLEQQPGGLAIRKEVYRLRGLIDSSHLRHPGRNISPTMARALQKELHRTFPGIDITEPLPAEILQV